MIGLCCLSIYKNGDNTIHQEESFKGPKGTNLLWTLSAADYRGQLPWTYIRDKGLTWKAQLKNMMTGLQGFLDL